MRDPDSLATAAIDAALWVHRRVGPGCLESVYETLLFERLRKLGISVERQVPITIDVDGIVINDAFRVDLLLERTLPLELKATEQLAGIHARQLLTYLRLMNLSLGLLINFGQEALKGQVRRVVNNHRALSSSLRLSDENLGPTSIGSSH